jgi:hypothetical protein
VAGIEDIPLAREVDFEPGAEIHGRGIGRNTDVAEIPCAIAGGYVEAAAEGDREMSEIAANAATLVVSIPCGPERARVLVPEFKTIMDVIADGLHASPAGLRMAE